MNYTFWHLSFFHTGTVMSHGNNLQKLFKNSEFAKLSLENLMGHIYKVGAVIEHSAFSFTYASTDLHIWLKWIKRQIDAQSKNYILSMKVLPYKVQENCKYFVTIAVRGVTLGEKKPSKTLKKQVLDFLVRFFAWVNCERISSLIMPTQWLNLLSCESLLLISISNSVIVSLWQWEKAEKDSQFLPLKTIISHTL